MSEALARRVALAERHPHVFSIQYPPSRELFRRHYRAALDLRELQTLQRALIYLHVPFCEAKCYYCNFAVDVRPDPGLHRRYVDALVRQVDAVSAALPGDLRVPGIDIGGGTPTLLAPPELGRLMQAVAPLLRRAEVPHALSIETTPRVAATEPDKLALLREGGVARVSVGIQSTSDEVLEEVGRKAQRALADAALVNLRAAGFRRVSVDLVFGLPGQSTGDFKEDLLRVADHRPDAITTYDCLYRGQGRALPRWVTTLPSAADYRAFYDLAYDLLHAGGYAAPYGSLNFCRHPGETGTSPYFEGRLLEGLPYLGLGSYASSLIGARWWFAPHATERYIAAISGGAALPAGDAYALPAEERMAKALLASLNFGVIDRASFAAQFGRSFDAVFAAAAAFAVDAGWLDDQGDRLVLRPGRFDALPRVRSLFYSDAAIDWVERSGRHLPIVR